MTVELAACQVYVTAEDYASAGSFERLLARVGAGLDAARERRPDGSFAHPCLAVFPEMIGAFLPLAGRLHRVGRARTTDAALRDAALRELPRIAAAMIRGRTTSTTIGFLLAAAPGVERIYRDSFSAFARRHQAWVVAGSALLPRGRKVYNTSYTFSPDGALGGTTRKVNLVPTLEDELGLSPGRVDELAPVDTPFGKVGTLICYDGFREPHTSREREPCFEPLAARYDALGVSILAWRAGIRAASPRRTRGRGRSAGCSPPRKTFVCARRWDPKWVQLLFVDAQVIVLKWLSVPVENLWCEPPVRFSTVMRYWPRSLVEPTPPRRSYVASPCTSWGADRAQDSGFMQESRRRKGSAPIRNGGLGGRFGAARRPRSVSPRLRTAAARRSG
jgi:predicted amidohydrolase